jgi:hypothetical protein
VILEDEPDAAVAERGLLPLAERERILSVERDRARRRRLEHAEDVEQRALPATRGAHDGHRGPAVQRERDAVEDREIAARRGI